MPLSGRRQFGGAHISIDRTPKEDINFYGVQAMEASDDLVPEYHVGLVNHQGVVLEVTETVTKDPVSALCRLKALVNGDIFGRLHPRSRRLYEQLIKDTDPPSA